MAYIRETKDIIKGSALMLFIKDNNTYKPIGFATEHAIELNLETTDISCKDMGDFSATLPQRLTWSGSASNLYSDEGEEFYMRLVQSMTPIDIVFAKATEYNGYGDDAEIGIVNVDNAIDWIPSTTFNGDHQSTDTSWGGKVAEGKALITNFSINASAGDNATMSIQLQGVGALKFKTTTNSQTNPANPQ